MKKKYFLVVYLIFSLLFIVSCAKKPKPVPVSEEDNPAHHYLVGMKLIEKGNIVDAENHFKRAIYLNKDFSPAYGGEAIVYAIRTSYQTGEKHKQIELENALKFLKKSKKKAENDTEEFIYHINAIRVYTEAHPRGWLIKAENHYNDALSLRNIKEDGLIYYGDKNAVHYFMGYAYFKAYKFRKSEEILAKVISSKPGKWNDKADNLYKKVQKIVRACGHYTLTKVAAKIAVKDVVTRGDVAALLVDDLHLNKLFAGRIPVKSKLPKIDYVPMDVKNHPFKDEILTVLKWNVRGLQADYDATSRAYLFNPQKPVKRKELAFILEDLIIKLTGKDISTKYFGNEKSPFPDVSSSVAWYNAVMTATSRGLMEPDLSGEFRPDDNLDGAELILALMKLRNIININ